MNLQIVYILHGSLCCRIDGIPFNLAAGEAMLLMPFHIEQFNFSPAAPTRHGSISITAPALQESWFKERGREIPRRVPCSKRMLTLASWLTEEPEQTEAVEKLTEAFFADFFIRSGTTDIHTIRPDSLLRVERFLQAGFSGPLKLKDLARAAALSPAQLIRIFRQHLHMTPMRYLLRFRLERAAEMLRDSGYRVGEIAEECGFAASEHFSRAFKQEYGLAPRAYRSRCWKGDPL